jgi:mRNA interferase RelE/StbE
MHVSFLNSFQEDLTGIREKSIHPKVLRLLKTVEDASIPSEIPHMKKLSGSRNYYRIRLGSYRIGLILNRDEVVFARILHRKDIYRYFP